MVYPDIGSTKACTFCPFFAPNNPQLTCPNQLGFRYLFPTIIFAPPLSSAAEKVVYVELLWPYIVVCLSCWCFRNSKKRAIIYRNKKRMKRNNEGEKIMGPMFPRLHVNDTEKVGPRAPPRNKMALYEQLSIPSQRFNHVRMPQNPNNNAASSVPSSSMGGGNDRGCFSARLVHRAYPSENQYSQYSESSTSPPQVEQRKKIDDNDYRVPIFIQPIPQEFDKYSSGFSSNPPYLHPPLKFRQTNETSTLEISIGDEGRIKKRENSNAVSLERDDTVSETSILDTESALEITPDDIVGAMGQEHFWKARRAIMNQQRVFAVQVFELHRLIKVQRSIAASPRLLHDDTAYLDNPKKPSPAKKRPLDYADNAASNTENPSHKECSAENTVEKKKSPLSSARNGFPASTVVSTDRINSRTSYFDHPPPHGHQWLIPIMSPSEGLVYKPCPGPGFLGPIGSNPMIGNCLAPIYGHAAPSHPFLTFYGPHYGMPVMSSATFSARKSTSAWPVSNDGPDRHAAEEIESGHSRVSNGMLRLFPMSSPATDASESNCRVRVVEPSPRVIKVVPHNAISASESAARIFQSIQEERKLYDSV